ncbi:caspase family protein [Dyadobacter diqingensis]|uniref:caspase family protein n=1 Tax=Dyadobacter diqingensis TaxID=2938121 RepID=UPI0020C18BBB|nr:caspase family protein [Dyadobacter diqingensis]
MKNGLLLFIFFLVNIPSFGQTIHFLGFINTDPGDQAMKGNLTTIAELNQLAETVRKSGQTVNVVFMEYKELSVSKIKKSVQSLKTGPDDAVFCYVASHGWNDGTTDTPMIAFNKANQNFASNSINLREISEIFRTKNVRLKVVIGESCNVLAPVKRSRSGPEPTYNYQAEAISRLFREASGEILFWSAKTGQKSVIDIENGGVFAQSFLSQLRREMSNPVSRNPDWEQVMKKTSLATSSRADDLGFVQNPERIVTGLRYGIIPFAKAERILVEEEKPSHYKGFDLEIKTDRGRENLVYQRADTMKLFVRVSQPAYLRLIYLLQDGTQTLLLNNYYVSSKDTNTFVTVPGPFICSSPFGDELLMAFASDSIFPALNTTKVGKFHFINGTFKNSVEKSRGIYNDSTQTGSPIQVPASVGAKIVEDKLFVTTKDN